MSSINPKIALLRAAWVNEKCAPDILQYLPEANELVQAVTEQQRQVDLLNDESSPAISLYQQDIERVRFLLASYARVRLRKIELQHLYIYNSDEIRSRLSEAEIEALQNYVKARASHLYDNVIGHLPSRAQRDDSALIAMNASMQPILSTHVFARINETVEGITPEDRPDADPIDLAEGHDVLLKYSLVRNLVMEGKVQLH